MPDFFGARIDEEGLWGTLRQLIAGIQSRPDATIDSIKRVAAQTATAGDFIEKVKAAKLWSSLKEIVARLELK